LLYIFVVIFIITHSLQHLFLPFPNQTSARKTNKMFIVVVILFLNTF